MSAVVSTQRGFNGTLTFLRELIWSWPSFEAPPFQFLLSSCVADGRTLGMSRPLSLL